MIPYGLYVMTAKDKDNRISAISIMNACLWGIGWNLIELRIKNLLRRMVATQLKKSALLLSHGLNRMFISAAELLLLYVFVHFFLILQFRRVCWRFL